jgi:hypothetical protein
MKSALTGDVAMLDPETKEKIAAARERLFGRLRDRIAELDVSVDHVAQTGATLCQVRVLAAGRIQVLARHRDRDALKAVVTALERARLQIRRAFRTDRRHEPGVLSGVNP